MYYCKMDWISYKHMRLLEEITGARENIRICRNSVKYLRSWLDLKHTHQSCYRHGKRNLTKLKLPVYISVEGLLSSCLGDLWMRYRLLVEWWVFLCKEPKDQIKKTLAMSPITSRELWVIIHRFSQQRFTFSMLQAYKKRRKRVWMEKQMSEERMNLFYFLEIKS